MARKPNYRFDRLQKDRAKAAKKAERLEAKRNRSAAKSGGTAGVVAADGDGDGDTVAEGGDEAARKDDED